MVMSVVVIHPIIKLKHILLIIQNQKKIKVQNHNLQNHKITKKKKQSSVYPCTHTLLLPYRIHIQAEMPRDKKRDKNAPESKASESTTYKEFGWDNDEVWSVDTSEDAVEKRKQT
eukprot:340070_1